MAKALLNDLPVDLPKKTLESMFTTYPKLNLSHPTSYVLWSGEKIKTHLSEICHASMRYEKDNWDQLVTAVPKSDQLSLEYLRMLIRGPFRSMAHLIRLDRVKDNYYIHCMSLDLWPANVLFNFCIASRIPIEFDYFLKPWATRCEAGFDATLAFLLTYSYGKTPKDKVRSFYNDRVGHLWLDPASSWTNILHGEFINPSAPFKTNPNGVTPTNCIWGISEDYKKLKTMSDEEVAEFYEVPIRIAELPPQPKAMKVKINPLVNNYILQAMQAEQALPPMHVAQQVDGGAEPGVAVLHDEGPMPPPNPLVNAWNIMANFDGDQPQVEIQPVEAFPEPDDFEDDPVDEFEEDMLDDDF